MHKTWRASDILLVLLLVAVLGMLYLVVVQQDRLHMQVTRVVQLVEGRGMGRPAVLPPPAAGNGTSSDNGDTANPQGHNGGDGARQAAAGNLEKQGDWLVRRLGVKIKTLNPLTYADAYAGIILGYLFDQMIERDLDTLEWKPKMAESWTVSADGLTLTFKLRKGMLWSDGQPITAQDVVFSYETVVNPKVLAARSATYYKDVKSVKALDDYTVEFKYLRPYFLSLSSAGGIMIIPKHLYYRDDPFKFNEIRTVLASSGPYVVEKWDEGQQIVLARNPRYYGPQPNFDKIVFRIVQDDVSAMQRLKAEQIDFMSLTADQWVLSEKNETLNRNYKRLRYRAPSGYSYIGWNNRRPPFDDRRVRLAMTHLIPRARIARELLYGLYEVVSGPFWPGGPGLEGSKLQYDRTIKPYRFDPPKALQLLREAGWVDSDGDGVLDKDGRKFSFKLLLPSGSRTGLEVARAAREEMARVGVNMEIMQLEWTVFIGNLNKRDFDACSLGWSGGIESDPYQIWHSSSFKNKGSNHIGFNNPEADRLIEEARQEMDTSKRNAMYHRFHRILHEEQPYTFLFYSPSRVAVHKRFKGVKVHLLGLETQEWWTPRGLRLYAD